MTNPPVRPLLPRTETYPDRAAWLDARRSSLGGSDSPKILGLSRWGSPMSVYADKLGLVPDDAAHQEAAEWGLLLEPLVAARYQRETGLEVLDPGRYTLIRRPGQPPLHTSPDRFVEHPTRGRGLLSVKTTSAYQAEAWIDGVPLAYQVQSQHEMLVTGLAWSAVAVLIGGQTFRYVDCLERDDRFLAALVEQLAAFWTDVETQTPPAVDASAACQAVLRRLYPVDSGETIALPAELLAIDAQWQDAKKHLTHWQTEKDRTENHLRAALGAAAVGLLPDGTKWTNKTQTRKEYVVPAATYRVLRRTEAK
jgi:putative phage-type endonuclease